MRDWLGQTQNFIGNVPIEEIDPKAKRKKKEKEKKGGYSVCRSWLVIESKILNFSSLDIERYTK